MGGSPMPCGLPRLGILTTERGRDCPWPECNYADPVCIDLVCQCPAAVLGAADDRQDAVAIARWHTHGLEHVHGLLSSHASGGLRLFSYPDQAPFHSWARHGSHRTAVDDFGRAANRPFGKGHELDALAIEPFLLADPTVTPGGCVAVFHGVDHRPFATTVV